MSGQTVDLKNRGPGWLGAGRRHGIGVLLLGGLLAACASNPYRWPEETRQAVEASLEEARAAAALPSAPPAEVQQGLLPPLELRLPEGRLTPLEPRFDFSVHNAPARQVFLSLVEGTPYSMVVHPEVRGQITLELKGVTVPEVMSAIREVYGYDFRREGNRFYVLAPGMQTRIFPVNYLNLNRHGRSDTRIVSGELTQTTTAGSTAGATSGIGGGGLTATSSRVPTIRVETESRADFWRDLRETLATMIGCRVSAATSVPWPVAGGGGPAAAAARDIECPGQRLVATNPQASLVVVRAMPEELRAVEEYLGLAHAAVNRQVILEAKIIDVQLNDRFQTGINWAGLLASDKITLGQVGGGTIFSAEASEIAGNSGNLNPGASFSAISGTDAKAFGGIFTIAAKTGDFAAFLELLKTQGEVHVLSSPRVSTVNNQKAVIKVGGEEFFVTNVTSTPTTLGLTTTVQQQVELTPFFSGIALDVTPQIDPKGGVILHIHPSVSEVVQRAKKFTVGDQAFDLPLAASTVQESDNVVRALSGQIIVIGGLMKEGSTDNNASVPLLGDIPILGNLFKHKRLTRIKRELVILLKPTVVETPQDWGEAVGETQERIKRIRLGS
jgi:MSHA biogenesis protein MshL